MVTIRGYFIALGVAYFLTWLPKLDNKHYFDNERPKIPALVFSFNLFNNSKISLFSLGVFREFFANPYLSFKAF